ncbi:MAG TPA: pitrilysin family protein [Candidatus Binatia bacterium]|nr:pitrilysin family protein [Candidatus Binatia bacterium]
MPRLFFALLALIAAARPVWAAPLQLPVETRTLRNGLRVLIHEDHSAPVVSSYIFFRAGSRNEQLGQTGIAHLFEHMMFNGGKKFGPGVFDDLIEGNGGSTNGYTTRDYTAYLNNFPREALPVVLDLESDRMWHLAITPQNLEQERGIVMEERRLRVDNDVEGTMNEALYLHAFVRSPYRWNTVGFMADLKQITLAQAKAYFGTYYAPNNAVLVLAGDVEPEAAFKLVDRMFGGIPSHAPPPPVNAEEPPQDGERRITIQKRAELPSVLIGWQAVRAMDPDRAALDVVSKLLTGGDSARLDEDLVRKQELVTSVGTDLQWGIDTELFYLYAQARPGKGKTVSAIVDRIDVVLADMAKTPVTPAELATAKRQLRADYVKGLKTVGGKANQLGFFDVVFGDYKALFTVGDSWEPVTADDVRRVIGTYLIPSHRTVVELQPVAAEPVEAAR